MSVDDWARREAERRYPATWKDRGRTDRDDERDAFSEGAGALADALLSDEAVEAACDNLLDWANLTVLEARRPDYLADVRSALQAAIDAVTKDARP